MYYLSSDSQEVAPADDGMDLGVITGILMGVGELTDSVLGVCGGRESRRRVRLHSRRSVSGGRESGRRLG